LAESELAGEPRRHIAHARCAMNGLPSKWAVKDVDVVDVSGEMSIQLPVRLQNRAAAFVARSRCVSRYQEIAGNAVEAVVDAFAPVKTPPCRNRKGGAWRRLYGWLDSNGVRRPENLRLP
jgi:hypothetical protein